MLSLQGLRLAAMTGKRWRDTYKKLYVVTLFEVSNFSFAMSELILEIFGFLRLFFFFFLNYAFLFKKKYLKKEKANLNV